jgi:hypothetical protein
MHIDYLGLLLSGLITKAEMIWAALWIHPRVGAMFVVVVVAGLVLPTARHCRRRA